MNVQCGKIVGFAAQLDLVHAQQRLSPAAPNRHKHTVDQPRSKRRRTHRCNDHDHIHVRGDHSLEVWILGIWPRQCRRPGSDRDNAILTDFHLIANCHTGQGTARPPLAAYMHDASTKMHRADNTSRIACGRDKCLYCGRASLVLFRVLLKLFVTPGVTGIMIGSLILIVDLHWFGYSI
jgi:hypothetical protein